MRLTWSLRLLVATRTVWSVQWSSFNAAVNDRGAEYPFSDLALDEGDPGKARLISQTEDLIVACQTLHCPCADDDLIAAGTVEVVY